VFPRTIEDPLRLQPVWVRPENERKVILEDEERARLIAALRNELTRLLPTAR
jgi:hypothetical protein